jgi:hypothetical protein
MSIKPSHSPDCQIMASRREEPGPDQCFFFRVLHSVMLIIASPFHHSHSFIPSRRCPAALTGQHNHTLGPKLRASCLSGHLADAAVSVPSALPLHPAHRDYNFTGRQFITELQLLTQELPGSILGWQADYTDRHLVTFLIMSFRVHPNPQSPTSSSLY